MAGSGKVSPGTMRVRVCIGTTAIRACFETETPPVRDDDWDEAAYLDERRRLYVQALEGIDDVASLLVRANDDLPDNGSGRLVARCPDTGDLIRLEANEADALPETGEHAAIAIAAAVQRVLADRYGWRRHLAAAWFERHRTWRARVGSPIQH